MTAAFQIDPPYTIVCSTSDEQAWLRARRTGIGASEAAALCEESPWDSPYSLWARKSNLLPEKDETEPMRWGKLLEPVILREYGQRSKRGVEPHGVLIRSTEHPWALATLDGRTWEFANDNAWPLEIKNSSAYSIEEWEDGPPRPYYLQIQHQMLVTGARKATIAALLGGNRLAWCDVPRDEIAIKKIAVRGEKLWKRIQDNDPPEVDGHEATSAALKAIYPADDKTKTVLLDAAMLEVANEFELAKSQEKAAKERIELRKNQLIAAIGEATRGILPDGRAYSCALQKRGGYVVKPTEFRVLRAIAAKR